ncbi:hypothetical protein [uncultured Vagococcus sp.]|uniref:hypothetical protein n=1 Tax=uncultured Vagococcus sp. TaxID=189676 RepID=UPI0028D64EDC|nr:hypothetical protein [uncultured Vagococcus sp.]
MYVDGLKITDWVKGSMFEYLLYNQGVPIGWLLSQDIVGGYGSNSCGEITAERLTLFCYMV